MKRATDRCDRWPEIWEDRLTVYDPEIVIVLVGGWDTTDRIFPEWGEAPRGIGDPIYDAWLVSEYEAALDLLTSRGARVIWLTAPCFEPKLGGRGVWDPERTLRLNRALGKFTANRRDEVELVDLSRKVCPDGRFVNELDGMTDIRPDGTHFSDEAADWIAEWLGRHIDSTASAHGETR